MDGPVVVSDRVSVFLLTDARHGTKIKDLFDIRVEVYGMGRVFFGTYIVVERVLRGSTVVPWQPQIRLQSQSLVEILYRQHIVLIVQCHLTGGDETVHIILRIGVSHKEPHQ